MKIRFLLAALALCGAVAEASPAAAQSIAYAVPTGTTNMRAGPGFDYPVIAIIRGGSAVNVYGCLSDFSWCDSSVQDIRGWVSTTRLQFQYGGNLVPMPRYYSYFDAPIIGFDFGYWDRYYRDRPFYRDRDRHHRRRDFRPPRDGGDNDRPGIFPEEGGNQYPPGNQDSGRRRHRDRNDNPPSNPDGNGIFPEEGGRNPPPTVEIIPPSDQGNSGPACPPGDAICR